MNTLNKSGPNIILPPFPQEYEQDMLAKVIFMHLPGENDLISKRW